MPHSTGPAAPSLNYWPPWPLFNTEKKENKPENAAYKRAIVDKYSEAAIRRSWIRTCKALEKATAEIESKRADIIPALTLDDLLSASQEKKNELRAVGCFVIRGVVPESDATQWYWDLKGYVSDNKEKITGRTREISLEDES